MIRTPNGGWRSDVSGWRKLCSEIYAGLTDEEKAIYEAEAEESNREAPQEEDGSSSEEGEDSEISCREAKRAP